MKTSYTLHRSLRAGWALCACLLVVMAAQSRVDARQFCDTCPPPGTQQYAWQANTQVTVNINPSFNQDQRSAIMAAFDNWQFSPGNSTGVTFSYTFSDTAAGGSGSVQVNSQTPNGTAQAETLSYSTADLSHLDHAVMSIDPRVTNLTAMTQAMAHEIGHTMGLGDCDTCCTGSTVMTPYDGNYNDTTSGRAGPGSCDTATSNQTIGTPSSPDYGGGGGGSRDCTPYYWVYYQSDDGGKTWYMTGSDYAGCW